jgi:hypothetical protein
MQRDRGGGRRRRAALATLALLTVAAATATLGPEAGSASSHREAPLISGEPRLDTTDVYAFVSPDASDSVTFVANWTPFEEPNGGPNFYPFATETAHDIHIDNNGDTLPDITYRWTFRSTYRSQNTFLYNTGPVTSLDDPDLNFRQTFTLQRIAGGRTATIAGGRVAPSRVGAASMPDYGSLVNQAVTPVQGGGKTFAGQAEDPFFLDLRVFDLLYGADLSEIGQDTLAGYNVNTIALQVPKSEVAQRGDAAANPVIGLWSTTSRRSVDVVTGAASGGYRQVSRLGQPLVNEAVIPLRDKNRFNASQPTLDARFLTYVTHPEVPRLIEGIYGIDAPATPRLDLVEVFLTGLCRLCGPIPVDLTSPTLNRDVLVAVPSEQLRLNMGVAPTASPNRMGVLAGDLAGFPNGRRLGDDVIDITLQVAEGVLLAGHDPGADGLGDGVNSNDAPFRTTFPYVALPHAQGVNQN